MNQNIINPNKEHTGSVRNYCEDGEGGGHYVGSCFFSNDITNEFPRSLGSSLNRGFTVPIKLGEAHHFLSQSRLTLISVLVTILQRTGPSA